MEETWTTRVALRLWPDLISAAEIEREKGITAVWQVLFYGPLTLAGLVWLAAATSLPVLAASWPVLLLLALLGFFWERLDFSALLRVTQPNVVHGRGVYGRMVTWSAALLFGPTALWLDWLMALPSLLRQGDSRQQTWWLRWQPAATNLARTTLPSLLALWLAARWGGALPLAGLTGSTGWLALAATGVRVGLALLVMAPSWMLLNQRPLSRLARLQKRFRFLAALVLFLAFPEPFALFAAAIYLQSNLWVYTLFLAGLLLVALLGQGLAGLAVDNRQQAERLQQLTALGQEMLAAPIAAPNLPETLAHHVPAMLPAAWVEIRLLPDTVLYAQADEWEPLGDDWWQRLADSVHAYHLAPPTPAARSQGFVDDGLLLPITAVDGDEAIGGVYVLFAETTQRLAYLPLLETLAAQIAALLHKQDSFDAALSAQAEAFEREVYEQALQAEVYAQALAYEKMSQELVAAGQIQASFLPRVLPEIAGWQLAVALEPARETSGDYYDVIDLGNGRWGLLVADVADKGMGPALFMALSRTMIRIYATEFAGDPAAVLAAANRRILSDTDSDLFVTVFYAVVDTVSGDVTYCNAGHNPGLLYRNGAGDGPLNLKRTALPLGVMDGQPWEQATVQMAAGDVLVLYSDGITEAQNEDADFFGQDKLEAVVGRLATRPADVIESRLIDAVYDFVGDAPQYDDMTLLVFVREP